ncbi:hypothetical protein TNCV_1114681 [Trichonephila clavipes]|nr:hypothetical protein TNCV_1114681 [Trichonephila clavipes]
MGLGTIKVFLGSRVQSVEECPTDAHLEHVTRPRHSLRCPNSGTSKAAQRIRHHLELQDRRDYTPADRAARTCWLGCPAAVLSGGLRRKTQHFSSTLYMAASSKTPPHQSKGPQKVQNPAPSASFP